MNRIGPRIVPCGIPLITSVINVKHVIPPRCIVDAQVLA